MVTVATQQCQAIATATTTQTIRQLLHHMAMTTAAIHHRIHRPHTATTIQIGADQTAGHRAHQTSLPSAGTR